MSAELISSIDDMITALMTINTTTNITTCVRAIDHYRLYQFSLIPSVIIIIVFSFFEKRKSILPHVLGGRPACIYPMDALTRATTFSYACAYGATVFLLYQVIFEQKFAFQYEGPLYLKTLIIIVSVVIYGLAFYPIFACITVGSMFSYGLGTMYVWTFTAIEWYMLFECDAVLEQRLIMFGTKVPGLACWVYLSFSLPVRFVLAARRRRYFKVSVAELEVDLTLQEIRDSYQGHAVKGLLTRPDPPPLPPTNILGKVRVMVMRLVHDWLYHWKKDFCYSSRMVSVMVTAIMILYIVTFEFISGLYPLFDLLLGAYLTFVVEPMGYFPEEGEPQDVTDVRNGLYVLYYIGTALQNCFLASTIVAFLIGLLSVLHMLSSYRRNLQCLYKGDHSQIPALKERSNPSHMVGFLRYAGYQVGYIAWAYIVQFAILFLLTTALATAIIFLINGYTAWLTDRVLQFWPVLLMTLALNIVQLLVSKFFFTQNRGEYMAMDNRRVLFVFAYFMFFFNVFLGLVSCLLRIIKSIVLGTLFLGRLDHSTLTRRFQFLDPGFAAYVGFLHVESAHTHPCVVVFVRLMLLNLKTRPGLHTAEQGCAQLTELSESLRRKRMGARFNWHVMYTLLNNPTLRMYRKGYIQVLNKALKEGKRRQISDKLADDLHALEDDQKISGEKNGITSLKKGTTKNGITSPVFIQEPDNQYDFNVRM